EGSDYRQQDLELQNFVGDDVQTIFPATGNLLHTLAEACHIKNQSRRFLCQQLASRRELQPIATTVEQQGIEASLQLTRRVRNGRWRFAQARGSAGQAAAVTDGFQQRQFVVGQHVRPLRTSASKRWYGK